MLAHGLAHACVLEVDPNVQGLWMLEQIRKWAPKCPVILCAENPDAEWVEQAYLKGAFQVLPKPLRPKLLGEVLQRVPSRDESVSGDDTSFTVMGGGAPAGASAPLAVGAQSLAVLRGFSGILTHSLDSEALLKQFLLFVRELFGLNRAMVFLAEDLGKSSSRTLKAAAAIGISQRVLDSVHLSFESGIGLLVSRSGRIVRRQSSFLSTAPEARREFEVLGAEVAVPIPDRENIIGVALLDTRITGESLSNGELELLFHLLEQLGLGLRNIALHEQLASNGRMLSGVLRELSSGCIVIDRDLKILHANKTARKYFPPEVENRARDFGFDDLPGDLGGKVYQVLHTGTALVNHRYEAPTQGKTYRINVAPFQSQNDGSLVSVLLMIEDLTQAEHMRKLELEAAELRLIRPMADRLSSEIGNAIVPIPVFAQLLKERHTDASFRETMQDGLLEASRRIERLVNQMRFLIGEIKASDQPFAIGALLEESYQEASRHQQGGKASKLKLQVGDDGLEVAGDRGMLKHTFMEIMLNGLQSMKQDPSISVRIAQDPENPSQCRVEIQDAGEGFSPESARRAFEPFYTTRTVGVGLGLAVAKRVIESHGGRIEIPAPAKGRPGQVVINLPASKSAEKRRK